MELNQLINQLLESGIIENQELGVTLLRSDEVTKEQKRKYINDFIQEYTEGKINFFNEEHKNIFKAWVELYSQFIKDDVMNRVNKIT
jgi:hypothetical protein